MTPTTQTESETKFAVGKFAKSGVAPLVQTDINELGDKRLSPEEVVCREREALLKQCEKKKIWGQAELEDVDRSGGPRMAWQDLICRLRQCNPSIQVRDGSPGSVALYFPKRSNEYTPADFDWADRPKDSFYIHHKYVGGFEKKPLPEYSSVSVDSSHLATRELRSWRSVLIGLIKVRVISYAAAIEEFGDPSGDMRSNRWFEQLRSYR